MKISKYVSLVGSACLLVWVTFGDLILYALGSLPSNCFHYQQPSLFGLLYRVTTYSPAFAWLTMYYQRKFGADCWKRRDMYQCIVLMALAITPICSVEVGYPIVSISQFIACFFILMTIVAKAIVWIQWFRLYVMPNLGHHEVE